MHKILIVGAGKIGSVIAHLLASAGDYTVHLADTSLDNAKLNIPKTTQNIIEPVALDIHDHDRVMKFVSQNPIDAIVSCLPHHCNLAIAELAKDLNVHYFDLTEDVHSTQQIATMAKGSSKAFVTQCGLAPGMINIIAHDLIQRFDTLDSVQLRCGALPVTSSNPLQYSLTWSTDGLINEYGNYCEAIENYEVVSVPGLSGLEEIQIDGLSYEAFSTSGGLGSLAQTYKDKVKTMNYKSVRYPGHRDKMRFLMYGLKLNEDRKTLKHILEKALPGTEQDVVLVHVSVTGDKDRRFIKESFVKKFYPREINGKLCAAIQLTTATSACIMVDTVLNNPKKYHGRVKQEEFALDQYWNNRFAQHFE